MSARFVGFRDSYAFLESCHTERSALTTNSVPFKVLEVDDADIKT